MIAFIHFLTHLIGQRELSSDGGGTGAVEVAVLPTIEPEGGVMGTQ